MNHPMTPRTVRRIAGLFLPILFFMGPAAFAHAFPERSDPHVGARLKVPPRLVTIWFDAGIEPVFSHLIVKSRRGQKVSIGNGFIPKGSHTILETRLRPIGPGVYFVYWSVIAFDGHHTEGRWYFRVR